MRKVSNRYSAFWNMFFPSRCSCCGELTEDRELICQDCLAELPYIPLDSCTKCGQSRKNCECHRINMLFSGIAVPFYNESVAKDGIYALKIKGLKDNAQFFGLCMAERFLEYFGDVKIDVITAVPMSNRKKLSKGFNHAEALAQAVAVRLNVNYNGKILKRASNKALAQHTLSYTDRMQNVKGIYSAKGNLQGKTVLLIDDIRTTSATLNACAKQLLLAGADEVYCATALLTQRQENNTKNQREEIN